MKKSKDFNTSNTPIVTKIRSGGSLLELYPNLEKKMNDLMNASGKRLTNLVVGLKENELLQIGNSFISIRFDFENKSVKARITAPDDVKIDRIKKEDLY